MSHELTTYLSVFDPFLTQWTITILSKEYKPDNFQLHNSLKLSFSNIQGFRSRFIERQSFLESNFTDIPLWTRWTIVPNLKINRLECMHQFCHLDSLFKRSFLSWWSAACFAAWSFSPTLRASFCWHWSFRAELCICLCLSIFNPAIFLLEWADVMV